LVRANASGEIKTSVRKTPMNFWKKLELRI